MDDLTLSKGGQTQEAIILAAYSLFRQNGYHGTSMRQIAQKAGIALGGIYNHFSSKEDIFIAVLLKYHPYNEVIAVINATRADTMEEFVKQAAHGMVTVLGDRRQDILNLLFIDLVEFNAVHIPQIFTSLVPQVMDIANYFDQHQAELRHIPPMILIRAFLGLFFSYIMTDILLEQQVNPVFQQSALHYFIDIFLHGILEPTSDSTT